MITQITQDMIDLNVLCYNTRFDNVPQGKRLECTNADFSGSQGLLSAVDYIASNFEKTPDGIIGYKTFHEHYAPKTEWSINPGAIISEVVNFSRQLECGCGVNVGTKTYVSKRTSGGTIWKVLIRWEWLAGVCVPYATDGKIRCERVELIESIRRSDFH